MPLRLVKPTMSPPEPSPPSPLLQVGVRDSPAVAPFNEQWAANALSLLPP